MYSIIVIIIFRMQILIEFKTFEYNMIHVNKTRREGITNHES